VTDRLSPGEALERIFEVIREEAESNPTFARRMLDAAGVTVVFSEPDAAKAADPIVVAAHGNYANFRESFIGISEKDLKSLIKGFALATDEQIKSISTNPKRSGLVDLLWEGARRKLQERQAR
jgi:hypothetical protein